MKDIEVELKFPLLNPRAAIVKLSKVAERGKDERQRDSYYNHYARDFLKARPVVEWLRLRETAKGTSLNYKHWHTTAKKSAVSCDEHETSIGDAAKAGLILKGLGCSELVIVDKRRRTWTYKDVEVAIDEVKSLGSFVELEAKGKFTSIDEAKAHLYTVVDELGFKLGTQDVKGYPYLLLEKKGVKLA